MIAVVYRAFDENGELLYVGSTTRPLFERVQEHRQGSPWCTASTRFEPEIHPDIRSAARAEVIAIEDEQPVHNVRHRGDPITPEMRAAAFEHRIVELSEECEHLRTTAREGIALRRPWLRPR